MSAEDGHTRTKHEWHRYLHVALDRREERLQPFIRGGVRKVASEDLWRTLGMSGACHVREGKGRPLKPGVSSTTTSCAAGGTPFSVTGAAGASDMVSGERVGTERWNELE